ncbi:MAG: hypothetical protein EXS32_11685 [Opitutus sp.]|nr:hypothetical protein [Opitutus sp.]
MSYIPTRKERLEDAKPYLLPAVAGVIVLALAWWLVWHELQPRREIQPVGGASKDEAALVAARQKISAEVDSLENTYHRAVAAGGAEKAAAVLDHAIEQQRARLRLEPRGSTAQSARLGRLEALRDERKFRSAAARSAALEQEAQTAQRAGQTAVATEKLREALQLLRAANANAATVDARDFPREARLTQAIALGEAEPLRAALEYSRTLAVAAVAQEHWADALKAYAQARAAQAELNQRFAGTRFVDGGELARLEAEIASLSAAAAAAAAAAREREGDAAAAAGRAQEAAACYAAAAQRELNEKFPRSRFVAVARVTDLMVKHECVHENQQP